MDYYDFLNKKSLIAMPDGIAVDAALVNPILYDYQRDIVKWALWKGRAAIFANTGLGKTLMLTEWARLLNKRTLMIAPLQVGRQTSESMQALLGFEWRHITSSENLGDHLFFYTNFERLKDINPKKFDAVIIDESSILKNPQGVTKKKLVEMWSKTPFRLACTATPAPNDLLELGSHAEFLGVMTEAEMKSIFFTYKISNGTSKSDSYRLKKHATNPESPSNFYRWLASWGMAIMKPSDLGYADTGFDLPPLQVIPMQVDANYTPEGMLPGFFVGNISATDAKRIRRQTILERAQRVAEMINASNEQWIIWTGLNDESDALLELIPDAIDVHGRLSPESKADQLNAFSDGEIRVLISKVDIAGFGMNFQNCHNMVFMGIDYSWEGYYQAIRRVWRHKQEYPVYVYVVTSTQEYSIFETILAKEKEAMTMTDELIKASRIYSMEELQTRYVQEWKYATDKADGNGWTMLLGDSVERMKEIPDNSVDLSVYSPPFADIFVYSATPRDVGNNTNTADFLQHYAYIVQENLRITKPGRMCCVHIADARALKSEDGYTGKKDLSGDIIQLYIDQGWIWKQRITIDKNPQSQAIRLKDHGLLFKTLKKDSTDLSGGHADYVLVFRKPGKNEVPVMPFQNGDVTSEDWIRDAHPVWGDFDLKQISHLSREQLIDLLALHSSAWNDIQETHTLNERVARGDADERHLCPLQLDLIDRMVKLWSNPGDKVFSPFAGIGSEGYSALKHGRDFLGIELKPEYWRVACRNLQDAESIGTTDLFSYAGVKV
jgi:DNA modification methylase/superfamily II DNA or RNA helicase